MEEEVAERLAKFEDDDGGKIKRLTRALAMMALHRDFEIIHRLIFGSQLDLLLRANAHRVSPETLQAIFEQAKSN